MCEIGSNPKNIAPRYSRQFVKNVVMKPGGRMVFSAYLRGFLTALFGHRLELVPWRLRTAEKYAYSGIPARITNTPYPEFGQSFLNV